MTLLSQNGWPASANKDAIGVKNFQVPGANRHFSCAQAVAPILIAFAAEFHKSIEPIDVGTYDDWGYNFAVIPNQTDYSNHASGTAIDIDATLHPWKRTGTFNLIKLVKLRLLVRKYGIRFGGDYAHGWVDPMHYEITESAVMVRDRIKAMKLPMPAVSK
jgi:D-alanyl-D-alanine carboxypeptidase